MPRIELISNTKLTGEGVKMHYLIRIDGKYLDNSICYDLKEAEKMLQFVKKNINMHDAEEVIEEIIVPEPNNDPKYF